MKPQLLFLEGYFQSSVLCGKFVERGVQRCKDSANFRSFKTFFRRLTKCKGNIAIQSQQQSGCFASDSCIGIKGQKQNTKQITWIQLISNEEHETSSPSRTVIRAKFLSNHLPNNMVLKVFVTAHVHQNSQISAR